MWVCVYMSVYEFVPVCVCLGVCVSSPRNNKFSGTLFIIFGTILGRLDTSPPMVAIWSVSQVLHVFLYLFYHRQKVSLNQNLHQ